MTGLSGPEASWGTGTVGERLAWQAEQTPDRPFLLRAGVPGAAGALTYRQVLEQALSLTGLLASLGVGRGDRVHAQLGNTPELLVALFAVARLGAVLVPTHPSSTVDDITYVMSHASCRVSVCAVEHVAAVAEAAEMVDEVRHLVSVGGQREDSLAWEPTGDAPRVELPAAGVGSRDLLAVLYTSGSSGWPKGVMLSHGNLLFAGEATAQLTRLVPEDRWLVTLPLSHANALLYSVMSAFVTGASAVLVAAFQAEGWTALAREHGATLASLFAVHVRAVLAAGGPADAPQTGLRLTLYAQHLTEPERQAFADLSGSRPMQVYGLTETLAPSVCDSMNGPRTAGAVGQTTPWADTRVVGPDGAQVPPGAAGELLVRGEPGRSLMLGYLGHEDDTRRVLHDDWFSTGDRLRRLPDGSLEFLGRAEEIIKPGVDNVSAAEVERVLVEHVSVVEAAVVSVGSPQRGEEIVGFVVLRPEDDATVDEVLAYAQERLAAHKVPRQVVALPALPRNAVGKVLKRQLRLPDDPPGSPVPPAAP